MTNLNIYCLSLKYYQIIDKLPSYIKPLGLGNEEYPKHWLTEKSGNNIARLTFKTKSLFFHFCVLPKCSHLN